VHGMVDCEFLSSISWLKDLLERDVDILLTRGCFRFMAASKVLGEETIAGQGNTQSSRES
jgi:hypothetical protein